MTNSDQSVSSTGSSTSTSANTELDNNNNNSSNNSTTISSSLADRWKAMATKNNAVELGVDSHCGSQTTTEPTSASTSPARDTDLSPASTSNTSSTLSAIEEEQNYNTTSTMVHYWNVFTEGIRYGLTRFVLFWSLLAARHPKRTIVVVSIFSLLVVATGFLANFQLKLNDEDIFAPKTSDTTEHFHYVTEEAQYLPGDPRFLVTIVHGNGENVMNYQAMDMAFRAIDTVLAVPTFTDVCGDEREDCQITSPARYWDYNSTLFRQLTNQSNELTIETLNREEAWAQPTVLFGKSEYNRQNTSQINYAKSLFTMFKFDVEEQDALEFEKQAQDALFHIRQEWLNDPSTPFQLEFLTYRSVPDEAMRSLLNDIPLVPVVFAIMACFTCLVFTRKDPVQSRSLLGVGSVVTIFFSILTGFGFCFLFGLPFTSMTQILPFVVFGVGLDDTFIITGAYLRTDPRKEPLVRIEETMTEVGSSISLTTITTTTAFVLGCLSTIPVIQWLCIYAFVTIIIDFMYQITFFIAVLVLDERRIAKNKRGCCVCFRVSTDEPKQQQEYDEHDTYMVPKVSKSATLTTDKTKKTSFDSTPQEQPRPQRSDEYDTYMVPKVSKPKKTTDRTISFAEEPKAPLPDRVMEWYSQRLLRPNVKKLVLLLSAIFFGACLYGTSQLRQDFRPEDFVPDGSYSFAFLEALESYTDRTSEIRVYFRDVNQSDPEIRREMIEFVNDVASLEQINSQPPFCWVRDFQAIEDGNNTMFKAYTKDLIIPEQTFEERLDMLLSFPFIKDIYGHDISVYPEGHPQEGQIETSRCTFFVNGVGASGVEEQIQFLADQRAISMEQPTNEGRDRLAFFAFDKLFLVYEFYSAVVDELIMSTISGVISVSLVAFVLIPHRTAAAFVLPMITVMYVDLMGTIQFAGMFINPLSYLLLVMSIGLLVDFLLHVLLRYYESEESTRDEKVKDMLRTMGSSILMGGLSTLLGVVPLAFSSNSIIRTLFTMFFAMVSLGIINGLIVLPVVLSYWGPLVSLQHGSKDRNPSAEIQTQSISSYDDTTAVPPPIQTKARDETEDFDFYYPSIKKTLSPKETSPNMRRKGDSWSWDKGIEVDIEMDV